MFGDAVVRLEVGGVTEPIRSASGFHLVQLVDKRGAERQIVEQTRARHILVAPDELTDENAARRRLATLRERIVNGEDFGELARVHSDDSGSAAEGRRSRLDRPGNTVPAFERVMESLEAGGLSRPFKSLYGWHIVQVLERRERDDTDAAPAGRGDAQAAGEKDRGEHAGLGPSVARRGLREYRLDE